MYDLSLRLCFFGRWVLILHVKYEMRTYNNCQNLLIICVVFSFKITIGNGRFILNILLFIFGSFSENRNKKSTGIVFMRQNSECTVQMHPFCLRWCWWEHGFGNLKPVFIRTVIRLELAHFLSKYLVECKVNDIVCNKNAIFITIQNLPSNQLSPVKNLIVAFYSWRQQAQYYHEICAKVLQLQLHLLLDSGNKSNSTWDRWSTEFQHSVALFCIANDGG